MAPVESSVSTRIDPGVSFVNDAQKKWDRYDVRVTHGYETRIYPFSKCWPIFKILTHIQNVDPFWKCWPIFKIKTHFQNIDPLSKTGVADCNQTLKTGQNLEKLWQNW